MKVFTSNFLQRLEVANQAVRELRAQGFRICRCDVVKGDALVPSQIEVAGGRAGNYGVNAPGVVVTRRVGSVS